MTPDSLQTIAERCRTDKASKHSYMPVYEQLVGHLRDEPLEILEIGVNGTQRGASVRMWLEAFPFAMVYGIDVQMVPSGLRNQPHYIHISGDAYNRRVFDVAARGAYDLIIDDGPHLLSKQAIAVQWYAKLLKPGGWLVIEDVNLTATPQAFTTLTEVVPAYEYVFGGVDRRHLKGRFDDAMFIVRRLSSRPEACRDDHEAIAVADQEPPTLGLQPDGEHVDDHVTLHGRHDVEVAVGKSERN